MRFQTYCMALLCLAVTSTTAAQDKKNIVLIAGMKSHGPEGNGIHDYAWSARLLETSLEKSNVADQVTVHTYLNGWPSDNEALRVADTIMIISDGRDGDKGREAPHLASPERVAFVDSLVKKGCGIVTFHFSTFAPDRFSDQVLDWSGGFFDWETDGKRDWYSDITTIEATVDLGSTEHETLRGVSPFDIREEFYFDIRFRESDPGWMPIWQVSALPATKPNGKVVAWAVERPNGRRGFGTTCGHFYDNWQDASFRKTILNAIAWTAHVPVPRNGIESDFLSRDEIAKHLNQLDLVDATDESKTYPDSPYWYQPGHPGNPAEPSEIKTLPGFSVSRVLQVPEELGSWTALCIDNRGRLLAAAQHRAGLHRITLPLTGDRSAEPKIETLTGAAAKVGWSHGLLYAFDSLYVTVSEESESTEPGVYRLRDSDGDDQFDDVQRILAFDATGEHGPHNIVPGPDGEMLYMICGNGTKLPPGVVRQRSVGTDGIDHLLPPGFDSSSYTTAGFVCRFLPDGSELEVVCGGLRNSFDLSFSRQGDLFTFDSDMEWDLGAPWYRPTRICQLVSGAEFGWRADAAKWPEHFEDSVAPIINIGPASPSGMTFGYGTKFPLKYQRALFVCDWTFATIHAVHLQVDGAGFRADVEEFVGGRGLPVTDIAVGADGALYFAVGGRRLGSAIYRIHYTGEAQSASPTEERGRELHAVRRRLERFHGQPSTGAIDAVWSYLGHEDRRIRFAARVAVETQPVGEWRNRAIVEKDILTKLTALLALARQGTADDLRHVVQSLHAMQLDKLPAESLRRVLRIYELVLGRGEDALAELHALIRNKLRPLFPVTAGQSTDDIEITLDRELSRILCFLQDSSAIDAILDVMEADGGQRPVLGSGYFVRNRKYGEAVRDMLQAAPLVDRMHHAQMLIWIRDGWTPAQRRRYFGLLSSSTQQSRGGYGYEEIWNRIREAALEQLPADQQQTFASLAAGPSTESAADGPQPVGPGQDWGLDDVLGLVARGFRDRDFDNGEKMFTAAKCASCHRFNGQGNVVGPDLSTLAQRFTIRDIIDSTLHPSKAVSDQFRITVLTTVQGRTISGRVVSRDGSQVRIATNLLRPSQSIAIDLEDIDEEMPVPVSTMPTKLFEPLNGDELLDLLAYLVAGGDRRHPVFAQ